jgi:hypothetical protein
MSENPTRLHYYIVYSDDDADVYTDRDKTSED